ncbi:MAG: RICIN domain-containing protein, partial [Gammaproteobacteria bacterium]|nr:RICIN domain-containing protein [Gammaproteobacteria bacterium]
MSSLPRPLTIAAGFFLLHSGLAVAQTQLVGAYHLEHADAGTVIYGDDAARLKLGRRTDASAQWVLESTGVEHHYRLRHTATGQLLTQQSTSVELQPDHPARAQLFKLDEPEPGLYRLTSTVSGQSLDASTGSLRFSTHGSTLLPWKLIPVGAWRGLDGQAVVTSTLSDKVLDVAGQEAGAPVVQWTYEKARNQHWTVVDAGTGYYRFQASHSDLLLRGMPSASPGQTLHQAAYRGDSDELFAILGTSDQVTLRHKSSGQLVSLPDWSVSNGTPLQLEPASPGATHQAFRLSRPAARSIAQSTSAASGGNIATPSPDESASAASVAAGPVFEERFDGLKTGLPWLNMND